LSRDDREDTAEADANSAAVNAVRALLTGIVDYAGLFPPAALDMPRAVRNYAAYRGSDDAWMLGRFVVPVARLDEFAAARGQGGHGDRWPLSALLGDDVARDVERAVAFNARGEGGATIESLEARAATPGDVGALAGMPVDGFSVFGELPWGPDPAPILTALRRAGFSAKIRTGGVTPESIPHASSLIRVMRACVDAAVPFKATAGLHHPIRGTYPLTYADGAPTGVMYGYLNVFMAAAALASGVSDQDAAAILTEGDPAAFALLAGAVRWRGRAIGADALLAMRDHVATSFGSCSFREPIAELRASALIR